VYDNQHILAQMRVRLQAIAVSNFVDNSKRYHAIPSIKRHEQMAQLNAGNCIPTKKHRERTAHGDAFSALLLLVLRIFADDHDLALTANDLALFADRLHGRTNLHVLLPPVENDATRASRMHRTPGCV
jgi:hypothetical protein